MALSEKPKFTVAICGGGIAGLAVAAFLSKTSDISIQLYEAKPHIRTIGAGIAIWKRYWDVLEKSFNFSEECKSYGISIPEWSKVQGPVLRKADNPVRGHDFYAVQHGPMVISRTVLLEILQKTLHSETCQTHTLKRLESYNISDADGVTLHFDDGTISTTDLLIGADGVHSAVRATMFKDHPDLADPKFSGQYAYRMKCFASDLEKSNPAHEALTGFKIWCGEGLPMTSNQVGEYIQMTSYQIVSTDTSKSLTGEWVREVPISEVQALYQKWEPDVQSLLSLPTTASRWAIHVVHDLPSYVSGNVALVGDAAHAMTPHQGLGGGQGIEDAFILARLLASSDSQQENLRDVLKVYDEMRRARSQRVAKSSMSSGHLQGLLLSEYKDLKLDVIGRDLGASVNWLLEDCGCEEEWKRAATLLGRLRTRNLETGTKS